MIISNCYLFLFILHFSHRHRRTNDRDRLRWRRQNGEVQRRRARRVRFRLAHFSINSNQAPDDGHAEPDSRFVCFRFFSTTWFADGSVHSRQFFRGSASRSHENRDLPELSPSPHFDQLTQRRNGN